MQGRRRGGERGGGNFAGEGGKIRGERSGVEFPWEVKVFVGCANFYRRS